MMSEAEKRLREFLESFQLWEGEENGRIHTTGEYNSENRVSLYTADIATVLQDLDDIRDSIND